MNKCTENTSRVSSASNCHVSRQSAGLRQSSSRGGVTVITGCMFSGKTTRLLRRIAAYPVGQVLAIKHVIDRRYRAHAIVSHAGQACEAMVVSGARELAAHIRSEVRIVAIDEGHFFDPALVDVVDGLADRTFDVIITALDRDSWGRPFRITQRLVALADEPIATSAVCARCGAGGDYTQRLTPVVEPDMVGGPERYEPRCRNCWTPPPEAPPA